MTVPVAYFVMSALSVSLLQADVTGVWSVEFKRDAHDYFSTGTCTFKQNDRKLTGDCGSESMANVLSGEVNGQRVTWRFKSGFDGSIHAEFSGELDDEATTIRGGWHFVDSSDGATATGTFEARKR